MAPGAGDLPVDELVNVDVDATENCTDRDPICSGPCPNDPYKSAVYVFGTPLFCWYA